MSTKGLYIRKTLKDTEPKGFFRIAVFGDLLLNSNASTNSDTLKFVDRTLQYYANLSTSIPYVDLVVVLGNAVNGTDWDGQDSNYFQDRWDLLMQTIMPYQAKVAFTLGDLDTKGNLKDPKKIVKYINSYGNYSVTYISPTSIKANTFYGIPVRRM